MHSQVTASSPSSPESFQVWVHLHSFSNNILSLPQHSSEGKRRLWLTQLLGYGSTGNVWHCRFDDNDILFAAKIVEVLRRSDADRRRRVRKEFNVYLALENAFRCGQLRDRIAPRCYGAFEGDNIDVLILDLCHGVLDSWDQLKSSDR
jgi:hypothetical protein